ncbi:MAG: hypothetical protein ACLQVJ_23020 [Syntrophobacteraceae bacterium]
MSERLLEGLIIRHMLLRDFGVDLPISGGRGNSLDNPVVLEFKVPNDYVSIEHAYQKYLGLGRRIEWRVIKQELIERRERYYDKIKIETVQTDGDRIIRQIENFYFDITDCFGRK